MGWTVNYNPTEFKNGKIDKKAQMTKELEHYGSTKVLACAMKGNVYYAACASVRKPEEVWAIVCLIRSSTKNYEFAYKDIEETMGPADCECPKSIIDMLTPTDSEYANAWREKCLQKRENGAKRLASLPIGTIIEFNGKRLQKRAPAFQFKTPWLSTLDGLFCFPKTKVPANFTIVSMPA